MAARAVLEQARAAGHEAWLQDMFVLAGSRASRIVGGGYVGIVKHAPWFFRFLYRAGAALSSPRHKSPVYQANRLMAKRVRAYLRENPCDVIVTTHLFPAETLTCLKRRGELPQPVVAVATDYTCIPFWEETECDYYILPHRDLMGEFEKKGLPKEKLLPLGIPVGGRFAEQRDKREARAACSLPPDRPAYLVMSGSMGFGRINVFAAKLLRECTAEEQIVILCGRNERMRRSLQRQFRGNPQVHAVDFTDRVADYMDACDVVFTKPGGLTSTEAAVKRIPIVHTAPIPGCETENLRFFEAHGMSVGEEKMDRQIKAGCRLLRDAAERRRMTQAQQTQINAHAASDLVRFLEQIGRGQGV